MTINIKEMSFTYWWRELFYLQSKSIDWFLDDGNVGR